MNKRKRELGRLAEREGLEKVSVDENGGTHLCIQGKYRGVTVKIVTSMSPSCPRTDIIARSKIRRAIRDIEVKHRCFYGYGMDQN